MPCPRNAEQRVEGDQRAEGHASASDCGAADHEHDDAGQARHRAVHLRVHAVQPRHRTARVAERDRFLATRLQLDFLGGLGCDQRACANGKEDAAREAVERHLPLTRAPPNDTVEPLREHGEYRKREREDPEQERVDDKECDA